MSTNKEERLADIAADMRGWAELGASVNPSMLLRYADRIDKATLIERADAATIASTQAVNLTDEKWKRETVTDCNGLGNAAKMREALEYVLKQYGTRKEEDCFEDHGDCEVCAGKNDLCWIEETARKVRAALDAPQRNCDRLETLDDACAAHKAWCEARQARHPHCLGGRDMNCLECEGCFAEWLMAPATPEKGA